MVKKFVLIAAGLLVAGGYCSPWASRASLASPASNAQRGATREGFPHEVKGHRNRECATCHLARRQAGADTDRPEAKDFPHTSCIGCHNFAAEFFKAALGGRSRFCSVCHEPRPISRASPALIRGALVHPESSDFANQFSHKAHRVGEMVEPGRIGSNFSRRLCTDCHKPLKKVAASEREMKTEMGHAACFVCHGAAPQVHTISADRFPLMRDCGVCHRLLDSGAPPRGQTIFGKIRGFRHGDHDIDIRPKRRSDFPLPVESDYLCALCHKETAEAVSLASIRLPAETFCVECHKPDKPGLPDRLSDEVRSVLRSNR
ncbi:MAG TPA: hypothetical protein VIG62_08980 [Blastocatellia bacterium]